MINVSRVRRILTLGEKSVGRFPYRARIVIACVIALVCGARANCVRGAVVASDDFTRPDGSLGTNWGKPSSSGGNLVVAGDQVGVDTENTHCFAYWSADGFND